MDQMIDTDVSWHAWRSTRARQTLTRSLAGLQQTSTETVDPTC